MRPRVPAKLGKNSFPLTNPVATPAMYITELSGNDLLNLTV